MPNRKSTNKIWAYLFLILNIILLGTLYYRKFHPPHDLTLPKSNSKALSTPTGSLASTTSEEKYAEKTFQKISTWRRSTMWTQRSGKPKLGSVLRIATMVRRRLCCFTTTTALMLHRWLIMSSRLMKHGPMVDSVCLRQGMRCSFRRYGVRHSRVSIRWNSLH